jgi:hypothetical protein
MTKKEIKKINLHKFVRKHLSDYTIVDHSEMIDTGRGEELVESILIKPNAYKKSKARYGFKINKKDNTVTVACDNVNSINLELDYVNGIDHYNDFMEKFEYHAISYSKTAEVIKMILEMGVTYKIYKNINISGFLNGIYGLLGKGSLREEVSTFFKYDSLGGISKSIKTEFAYFSIDKKKVLNEYIGFNECISLNIPIREHEIFNIIMKNNGGVEETYGVINNEYVLLRTDEDIKNHLREIFINAAKKSIYYKFGVEDQGLNDDYLTLIEMETI